MVYAAGILVLVFALAVDARVGDSSESNHCTETKECLMYNSICKGDDYEVRHYETSKWVSADSESFFMEVAINRAFWKLFKYIQGANDAGLKIDMTSPVVIKTKDGTSMWQSSVYTVSFLLPSTFQQGQTPPTPTDSSVYFHEMSDMKVYVKSYGGWLMGLSSRMKSRELRNSLDAVAASYDRDYHCDVGYDSPMKMIDRHNEVWYMVKGEPVCPAAGAE
ncbi:heme-binding protein 2 [Clupea harengus]|uniref:Heme-binding protein 1 n=1 Tax=Clupea harengus TaxID=7950 RepID=A0A6P3W3U3_CLUHA|nr:heme-binding protein 2 [Clupea harengus]